MRININLHYESEQQNCYNLRLALTPRYINWVITKHSGMNTAMIWEIIKLIRWDLTDYREHYQWIKNAWFDPTVKPPYDFNDYDPIPF